MIRVITLPDNEKFIIDFENNDRDIENVVADFCGEEFATELMNYIDGLKDKADYEELKFKAIKAHVSQRDPIIETALKLQAQYFAKETPYESAEVFRVLGSMHAHCFNLPVE